MTIQINAFEQCFLVIPFIMMYKLVLTNESMNEILKCDRSNKRFLAVLSCAVQGGSNILVYGRNPKA